MKQSFKPNQNRQHQNNRQNNRFRKNNRSRNNLDSRGQGQDRDQGQNNRRSFNDRSSDRRYDGERRFNKRSQWGREDRSQAMNDGSAMAGFKKFFSKFSKPTGDSERAFERKENRGFGRDRFDERRRNSDFDRRSGGQRKWAGDGERNFKPKNFRSEEAQVGIWLYGRHPVLSAIKSGRRQITQILVEPTAALEVKELLANHGINAKVSIAERGRIDSMVGENKVHQGFAMQCSELPVKSQSDFLDELHECVQKQTPLPKLLILDQLQDPQNIGAIIRSARAFGVKKLAFPRHNFPKETSATNKASSGAIEEMDLIEASNTTDLIQKLKTVGYFCVALDSEGEIKISDLKSRDNIALIVGSEGDGIRELVKKNCDATAKIQLDGFESLNASAAAAVALYEIFGS